MRLLSLLRARWRSVASVGLVGLLSAALAVSAIVYQGMTSTKLAQNDGGVWVTNSGTLQLGHLNAQARVLDNSVSAQDANFDVEQSGNTILLQDSGANTLSQVNPVTVALDSAVSLPAHADVVLGGQTVAVLDPATGRLWVTGMDQFSSFHGTGTAPTAKLGKGAAVTVDDTGVVHAVAPATGRLLSYAAPAGAPATQTSSTALSGLRRGASVAITAVGGKPVVLDATSGRLYLPGTQATVAVTDATTAVLQQPGGASSAVLVETPTGLISQPLDGSAARTTPAKGGQAGTPVAPVEVGGCSYAVWAGTGSYLRDCDGTDRQSLTLSPLPGSTSQLSFRVNRSVVALNDEASGSVWLVSDPKTVINDWKDVTPPAAQTDKNNKNSQTQTQNVSVTTPPTASQKNHPPVAVDDTFGVRAGRTALLPVLANDYDPDGDLLTASVKDPTTTRLGTVTAVDGGSELELPVPAGATGSASFTYTASDGRGGTATATVQVNVHPAGVNSAPVQTSVPTVVVDQGATISYDALASWLDPDGDPIFLAGATASGGDSVQFKPDGTLAFSARSGSLGITKVTLAVSDGSLVGRGEIDFDVRAAGSAKPVANDDLVTVAAGQTATVSPLANDESPSGATLTLAKVANVGGATINVNTDAGTFTFAAQKAGTYLVGYTVSDGTNSAEGTVRVDVTPAAHSLPPVAVPDTALLPKGGQTLVDVLANDTDPAGNVLAIQSVSVPQNAGIAVAIVNHDLLRITDTPGLASELSFSYTISDGVGSATTDVLVVPLPAPATLAPPVANNDTAKVRVGDIVTIPVLDNDYSPDGDTLTVEPKLVAPLPSASDGEAFVSQNEVRFQAKNVATTVHVTYVVADSNGQTASALVTIQIIPMDAATNEAPKPLPVTAQVVAGTTAQLAIPLDGIDPDGDSVQLVGAGIAPSLGRITAVGASSLSYEAYADSKGTDAFTYVVRDALGAEATASIRVAVIPPPAEHLPPDAVADHVTLRPNREVSVNVLANDTDPDDDPLTLTSTLPMVQKGITATVADQQVLVTTPASQGNFTIEYTISATGGDATGVLTVTVSDTAPLVAPIAVDDDVSTAAVVGKSSVAVDVLSNDSDPSGTTADLVVTTTGGSVSSSGVVTVPVKAERQVIPYTDTDRVDGLVGHAFIVVPGTAQLLPTLVSPLDPIDVKSGATTPVDIARYVLSPDGTAVHLVANEPITAAHASGTINVSGTTTIDYPAASGYSGPDALTFYVAVSGGQPTELSLPITVEPPANEPPTFAGASIGVTPGDPAHTFDLSSVSADPNPGDLAKLSYTVSGASSGVTASIESRDLLSVSAAASTQPGTVVSLDVSVSDGKAPAVHGTVRVTVDPSPRPLPVANPDSASDNQGTTVTVNALANDFDPFSTPLTIVSASVISGNGTARVADDKVAVTPASDFSGALVVQYRIEDASDEPSREVDGLITVTVAGRPAAPSTPTTSAVGNGTVTLSWQPGNDNGSPITGYVVKSPNGFSQNCPQATCTLTGLTNNTDYTFTVAAVNKVGTSDPSGASATVHPDVKPDVVTGVTATAPMNQSGAIDVSWNAAVVPDGGSPVVSYTVTLSNGGGSQTLTAPATSTTVTGLQNGVTYSVTVVATNGEAASDPSAPAPATPAGAPTAPGVTAQPEATSVLFTITPPATNGRAIAHLYYQIDGGAQQDAGPNGGQVSAGSGYDQAHSISVWAVDSDGRTSGTATASGTSSNPIPTISISEGAAQNSSTCVSSDCHAIDVSVQGGRANTQYTLWFWTNCSGVTSGKSDCIAGGAVASYYQPAVVITTNASGGYSYSGQDYGYPGGQVRVDIDLGNTSGGSGAAAPVAQSNTITWQ